MKFSGRKEKKKNIETSCWSTNSSLCMQVTQGYIDTGKNTANIEKRGKTVDSQTANDHVSKSHVG